MVLRARNASLILRTSNIFAVGLEVWAYDFVGFLVSFSFLASPKDLLFRKYLEITLTSLFDFAEREGSRGTFSIVIGTGLDASLLFLLVGGGILGVNLDEIFALKVLDLLSVKSESQLELYINEMKFQMESPIPSKSDKLLAFEVLTFLFLMYLAMKFRESLILLESDAICLIEL